MLTQARLKELLHYSPETGEFVRLVDQHGSRWKAGTKAGCVRHDGYVVVRIEGKLYQAHRLAFLYMEGSIPSAVDHVNNKSSDNRWDNLRAASKSQNAFNSKLRADNSFSAKGIRYSPASTHYGIRIRKNKIDYYVGGFRTLELASEFAGLMREALHGQFARHT